MPPCTNSTPSPAIVVANSPWRSAASTIPHARSASSAPQESSSKFPPKKTPRRIKVNRNPHPRPRPLPPLPSRLRPSPDTEQSRVGHTTCPAVLHCSRRYNHEFLRKCGSDQVLAGTRKKHEAFLARRGTPWTSLLSISTAKLRS